MSKKFKKLFQANGANIALWIIMFFMIAMLIVVLNSATVLCNRLTGECFLIEGSELCISVIFFITILLVITCIILSFTIAILLLIYHNGAPTKHKAFILTCGILYFFFPFIINCVVHNRLKRCSKSSEYHNDEGIDAVCNNYKVETTAQDSSNNYDSYMKNANSLYVINELKKMADLKDKGIITEEEFLKIKNDLLEIKNQ